MMIKMKNKKASHVGIVLSFVIFVTFLAFLYSIVEPTMKMQQDKESLLNYLKMELMERISANLTSSTITIEKELPQPCIELQDLVIDLSITPVVIVKGETGKIFPSKIEGDNLKIDRGADIEEFFFKIYNSEEFEEGSGGEFTTCRLYDKDLGQYTIGLVRTDKYIFETKINDLINEYETDYDNLKDDLNIPPGSEFGFSLIYSNETRIGTEEKEISTNIYSEEIPVQYVDGQANINSGFINILVW